MISHRRVVLLAMITVSFAYPAIAQNILCSTYTTVVGWGQYTCLPGVSFPVDVNLTVDFLYTYPTTASPRTYVPLGVVTTKSTGVCGLPGMGDALPPAEPIINLVGSGGNFNAYQHTWQGKVGWYGIYPGNPLPIYQILGYYFTAIKSQQAKGCCS